MMIGWIASTSSASSSSPPEYVGFICSAVAVLAFGTCYVPTKKYETGDGMFFQWVFCATIWLCGLVVDAIRGFPTFYPIAMLGGAFFATGNMMVVPIVKTIGLGQGILIWGSINLLTGWATGRFGLFGLHPEPPDNVALNYVGVTLCLLSGVVYCFVKSDVEVYVDQRTDQNETPLADGAEKPPEVVDELIIIDKDEMFLDKMSDRQKRALGYVLSVVSGLLYGSTFTPATYVQNNYEGASTNGLDYVFAQFCGVFVCSTVYFLIYCGWMQNEPRVYSQAILPGFVGSLLWSVAYICWFLANSSLSNAITFPIISSGPGMIASLIGIIFYKEIKGHRNFLILAVAYTLTLAGSICTGVST